MAQYTEKVTLGATLFETGDYAAARDAFTTAYEIHPDPVLLFNVASTYRRERDYAAASEYYRLFLEDDPEDESLVRLAHETIFELDELLETRARAERAEREQRQERAKRAKREQRTKRRAQRRRTAMTTDARRAGKESATTESKMGSWWKRTGKLSLLTGGLLAVGGIIELSRARDASQELDSLPQGTPWGPQVQQLFDDGQARDRRGLVLLVGGGVLAATGAIMYAIGMGRDANKSQLAVVPVDDSGALVVLDGSF